MAIMQNLQRHRSRIVIGLLIVLFFLCHVMGFFHWTFLQRMENLSYDARLLMTMPNTQDDRIVILDVDEKSLNEQGRWPWRRDKLAELVDILFEDYQIELLAFDMVFAEPDQSSGLEVFTELAEGELKNNQAFQQAFSKRRSALEFDQLFADSLKNRPVIMGYYFDDKDKKTAYQFGQLPSPVFDQHIFSDKEVDFVKADGYGGNLSVLQNNAVGAGHFNSWFDSDGVIRRIPLLYEFEDQYYESFSSRVFREIIGAEKLEPQFKPGILQEKKYPGLEGFKLGKHVFPVDERVRMLVPYRGKQGSFVYQSLTDVLQQRIDKSVLQDKIILIGTTTPGLLDLRVTPVQKVYPGVEIHANMIAGMLDQTIKKLPAYVRGAEFTMLLVSGVALVLLLPLSGPALSIVLALGSLLAYLLITFTVWQGFDLVLPVASGVMMILLLYIFNISYGYLIERRGKKQLASLFGHYVPPELVDVMSQDPAAYSLEAESREMTVMFCDIRGFTSISEGLEAKAIASLMNTWLTAMTEEIHQEHGTIDKYMGDGIMAFWGAPLKDQQHAHHAVLCGLNMLQRLDQLSPNLDMFSIDKLQIGIGINTGVMNVGNMGSEFRVAYTVMSDAVNLGSRLQELSKVYGVSFIVSGSTLLATPEIAYRELDQVRVRGRENVITIYQPVGLKTALSQDMEKQLELYQQAHRYYRENNWDLAELQFLSLQKTAPEMILYQMFIDRIRSFRNEFPEGGWNGVINYG